MREEIAGEEYDLILNAIVTAARGFKPYPNRRYWSKRRLRAAFDLYQKVGQAAGESGIALTWEEK